MHGHYNNDNTQFIQSPTSNNNGTTAIQRSNQYIDNNGAHQTKSNCIRGARICMVDRVHCCRVAHWQRSAGPGAMAAAGTLLDTHRRHAR